MLSCMKPIILTLLVIGSIGLQAQTVATNSTASQRVRLDKALVLYAELTDRTVLRYPTLPNADLTISLTTTNRTEAARAIETAATANGITIMPDGQKFALVAPAHATNQLSPRSDQIPVAGTNGLNVKLFPPDSINWRAVHLTPALLIYAEFLGQKLDVSALSPKILNREISFFNQTALTQEELAYALETLFVWQGVKLVRGGDGMISAVPASADTAKPPAK